MAAKNIARRVFLETIVQDVRQKGYAVRTLQATGKVKPADVREFTRNVNARFFVINNTVAVVSHTTIVDDLTVWNGDIGTLRVPGELAPFMAEINFAKLIVRQGYQFNHNLGERVFYLTKTAPRKRKQTSAA